MKDLIKRFLIGFILVVVELIVFYIAINYFQKREYKYLTLENEWGISNKCYIDNDQFAVCEIDEVLTIVRQYYES